MKYSTIKQIKNFCKNLDSQPCFREVVENIVNGVDDFEVENVRFINDSNILEIMTDEIFGDDYILGCFNAYFIADNSDLPYEMVKACQEVEAFEAIGKGLNSTLDQDEKESFCEAYESSDGYGHHFNSYDGNEEELNVNGELFHVFDNH